MRPRVQFVECWEQWSIDHASDVFTGTSRVLLEVRRIASLRSLPEANVTVIETVTGSRYFVHGNPTKVASQIMYGQ